MEKVEKASDRRDTPRVPMSFLVRDLAEGGSFRECGGDIAVGGAFLKDSHPPQGNLFEVRFRLPDQSKDIRTKAELLRVRNDGVEKGYHVRFVEMEVIHELAIAKYIEGVAAKGR